MDNNFKFSVPFKLSPKKFIPATLSRQIRLTSQGLSTVMNHIIDAPFHNSNRCRNPMPVMTRKIFPHVIKNGTSSVSRHCRHRLEDRLSCLCTLSCMPMYRACE